MLPILSLLPFFLFTNHHSISRQTSDARIGRDCQSTPISPRRWDAKLVKTSLQSSSGVEVNVDDPVLLGGTIPERAAFDVYARFSPLIGGPPLLPIHVEIMLLQHDTTDIDGVHAEENVNDDINSMKLHRMDFVPDDATNPETIGKLIGLQNVKGIVRHRTFVSGNGRGNEYDDGAKMTSSNEYEDVRKVSKERIQSLLASAASLDFSSPKLNLVLPLGSISVAVSDTTSISTSTSTSGDIDVSYGDQYYHSPCCPTSIVKLLQDKRQMELNLLSNNCYNFAYDLVECLREEEWIR